MRSCARCGRGSRSSPPRSEFAVTDVRRLTSAHGIDRVFRQRRTARWAARLPDDGLLFRRASVGRGTTSCRNWRRRVFAPAAERAGLAAGRTTPTFVRLCADRGGTLDPDRAVSEEDLTRIRRVRARNKAWFDGLPGVIGSELRRLPYQRSRLVRPPSFAARSERALARGEPPRVRSRAPRNQETTWSRLSA